MATAARPISSRRQLTSVGDTYHPQRASGFTILDIPDVYQPIDLVNLPANWQDESHYELLQTYLASWLARPDTLTISVPSAIVSRSRNYLLHTLHPNFRHGVKLIENAPFPIDNRLITHTTS